MIIYRGFNGYPGFLFYCGAVVLTADLLIMHDTASQSVSVLCLFCDQTMKLSKYSYFGVENTFL